jgi:hypothetical protein
MASNAKRPELKLGGNIVENFKNFSSINNIIIREIRLEFPISVVSSFGRFRIRSFRFPFFTETRKDAFTDAKWIEIKSTVT